MCWIFQDYRLQIKFVSSHFLRRLSVVCSQTTSKSHIGESVLAEIPNKTTMFYSFAINRTRTGNHEKLCHLPGLVSQPYTPVNTIRSLQQKN